MKISRAASSLLFVAASARGNPCGDPISELEGCLGSATAPCFDCLDDRLDGYDDDWEVPKKREFIMVAFNGCAVPEDGACASCVAETYGLAFCALRYLDDAIPFGEHVISYLRQRQPMDTDLSRYDANSSKRGTWPYQYTQEVR